MGSVFSYRYCYTYFPELLQFKQTFDTLSLKENEVGRLYQLFRKINKDKTGNLKSLELLLFLDIERNQFSERLFRIFSVNNQKEIHFDEFCVALWNYCTLEHSTLGTYNNV
jgi:Ca2+-binding EF-hand superfamily protein